MSGQMVMSEIGEYFHTNFVQNQIISQAFRWGKLLSDFGQNASEIILWVHEYTVPSDHLLLVNF